jgi:hypothetical protein
MFVALMSFKSIYTYACVCVCVYLSLQLFPSSVLVGSRGVLGE